MSFIPSTVECQACHKHFNVAEGVQGMVQLWSWPSECPEPECHGELKEISKGWEG